MASNASDAETANLISEGQKSGCSTASRIGICCCASLCVVLVLFGAVYGYLVHMLTNMAVDKMLVMNVSLTHQYCTSGFDMGNMTYNIWWPGCEVIGTDVKKLNDCAKPCFDADLLTRMNIFNTKNPGKQVSYSSRDRGGVETVKLTGWWLPAAANGSKQPAPRIALQHGFTANSNKFRTMLAAYMLRTLGFDVLINNFRDHCYSEDSDIDIYQWGQSYPYDLLGAWDYLRMDPDGALGGTRAADQVGLMGFSKGGFTTVNAFGLEHKVPAAWVDGPPFTPEVVFANGAEIEMQKLGIGFLGPSLISTVWSNVRKIALEKGVDVDKNLPQKVLPTGPDVKRPIYWVGNKGDTTVPIREGIALMKLVQQYPAKYDLSRWEASGTCNGVDHCVDHLQHFNKYMHELATFWSAVFGVETHPAAESM